MKRVFSILVCSAFLLSQATAQQIEKEDYLKLDKAVIDFGKIPQGKPVYGYFELTNTGTEALKLESVAASCGCTTPEWDRKPIAPGATARIKVGYNAAAEGYFDKPITLTYNGITRQLSVKGTVWKVPSGPAPANASVQFLKQKTL